MGLLMVIGEGLIAYAAWSHYGPKARAMRLLDREVQALSPYEFEAYVAAAFMARGWKARATKGSGDQGADVIAQSPQGVRYVVQVKQHKNAVGNKAVQEVVAAKAMYKASHALVVTSGPGYTKAAQALALANNVGLWNLWDLRKLKEGADVRGLV
ncbi:restriction endonuclease [Deinococcus yavapaiensis KR-236]|uniref:Restriction endonuclease n=2 Tax=Deinococcus TaxID=1298 RepID=A0A318SAH4_9DEIO|nr:restriction endonuclease [Deinococcus yavapaiensis KR-236]